MDILGLLWKIVRLYVPPKDCDSEHTFQYHVAQSVGILGIWLVAWLVIFWAVGKFPFIGPQVAWASDVQRVEVEVASNVKTTNQILAQLKSMQLLQLRANISEQLKYACSARAAHNQTDLDNANDQLANLVYHYQQLAGSVYPTPSCDTILIEK